MELYGYTIVAVTLKTKEIRICGTYFFEEDALTRAEEIKQENYYPRAIIKVQGSEIYFPNNV